MGRPAYHPTNEQREMVSRLAGLLVSEAEIAERWIKPPCSLPTLRKHFADELKNGRRNLVSDLKHEMLMHARNGSIRALSYLLDRLSDLPAPKREPEDGPQRPLHIVIKGGLPDVPPQIEGTAKPSKDDREPDTSS